jgi:hypothetical protein
MVGAKSNDTSEGSHKEEHKNSFFGENGEIFEIDRLKTVPFDDEVRVDYESDYTV